MVANPGMSFDALLVQTTTGNHDGLDNVDRKDFEVGLVATPQTGDSRAPAESRSIKQALPSAVVMQLPSPVYKPEWVDQFHGRIRWMVDQQVSSAQVIIDPPELGPMQVDIARTADNGTQITFTVNNLAIKELLDANMLRFKSVLASGENPSVQVDVRQQQQQQEQRQGQASASQLELERRYPAAERSSDRSSNMRESYFIGRPKGLLDHYV